MVRSAVRLIVEEVLEGEVADALEGARNDFPRRRDPTGHATGSQRRGIR